MKWLCTICLWFLCILSATAQQPSFFLFGEDEFEGIQIYDVIQDNKLNYWFATDHGFYVYDYHRFNKVKCEGIKNSSAYGFVINKQGTIYCYNLNNQIIKIENGICSIFYELSADERSNDISLSISEDNHVLVFSKTVLILDTSGKRLNAYKPPVNYYGIPYQMKDGSAICHIMHKDSVLIVRGNDFTVKPLVHDAKKITGLLKFFSISGQSYAVSTGKKELFTFDEQLFSLTLLPEIAGMETDEFLRFYNVNNQLWMAGTVSGVRLLELGDNRHFTQKMYSNYLISDVYKDKEGNMLLSTFNNGVLVVPNIQISDVIRLPANRSVVSLHFDNQIGMLMGSESGELISFKNEVYKTISDKGTRPLSTIFSWPQFPYVVFDDGCIKIYHKKSGAIKCILNASLKDACLMDSSTLYLALNVGLLKITTKDDQILEIKALNKLMMRMYSLAVDPVTGFIYVASSDGLKRVKPDDLVEDVLFNNEPIFANDISVDDKRVYISTKRNEIIIFEYGKNPLKIHTKLNQKEFEVYELSVDQNRIYANSSLGFLAFNKRGEFLFQLDKSLGFFTNKIYDFEVQNNEIWLSHSRGVQRIGIDRLNNKFEKPSVRIAELSVNDEPIHDFSKEGEFSAIQRKFAFTITSPSLKYQDKIVYYYKLEGYETVWHAVDYSQTEVKYNALAPGRYRFLVKGENQGLFSDVSSYSFVILAPLYQRSWFIVLTVLVFLLFVFIIYRWQLNIQRRKSEQINELNASKLTAIQSQMNPHFIFNSLNSIQDLILKGDVEQSYSYITDFSNMVRRTLNYSDKDFIEIDQEIKLLELYLSLEQLRLKKDFSYEIVVDEQVEDLLVPPLLVQPFVENALIHGLLHKVGRKELRIEFRMEESLVCTITDNGIGREQAKIIRQRQRAEHESFSGTAIHKRFEILSKVFNGKFGYRYEDLYHGDMPAGTRVTLHIPVKNKF